MDSVTTNILEVSGVIENILGFLDNKLAWYHIKVTYIKSYNKQRIRQLNNIFTVPYLTS